MNGQARTISVTRDKFMKYIHSLFISYLVLWLILTIRYLASLWPKLWKINLSRPFGCTLHTQPLKAVLNSRNSWQLSRTQLELIQHWELWQAHRNGTTSSTKEKDVHKSLRNIRYLMPEVHPFIRFQVGKRHHMLTIRWRVLNSAAQSIPIIRLFTLLKPSNDL